MGDGERDCGDGSDEAECGAQSGPGAETGGDTARCGDSGAGHSWPCASGDQCVDPDWVCDGDRDCDDGSDEAGAHCHPAPADNITSHAATTSNMTYNVTSKATTSSNEDCDP